MTRTLNIAFLLIIALGAVTGLVGLILAPEDGAAGNPNVTVISAPEQTKAETPARFILPDLEEFKLPDGENLAKGKTVEYSDYVDVYPGKQAVDGREKTYWESGSFPGFLAVDLGGDYNVSKAVLRLPPLRVWGKRTQNASISVSADGNSYTEVSPAADYAFDPQSGNAVLIEFSPVSARYVRVDIASNTGAKGGQLSEFCVYE